MDECRHGLLVGTCADCVPPPPGTKERVWITAGGNHYHNDPDCTQLNYWQGVAAAEGNHTHPRKQIPWSEARDSRSRCHSCVPPER